MTSFESNAKDVVPSKGMKPGDGYDEFNWVQA